MVSRLRKRHFKFLSANSIEDASFNELNQGTEPQHRSRSSIGSASKAWLMFTLANSLVFLVERMDILELEHKHGIEDLKKDIGDNWERIRDMDRRVDIHAKMERRSETQFAKIDSRFDRLEGSMDRWLFMILGLVSYSHYIYSTIFSKGI